MKFSKKSQFINKRVRAITLPLLVFAFVATMLLPANKASAATASIAFELAEENPVAGETFTLVVKVSTNVNLGKFCLDLSYDTSKLSFTGQTSTITEKDGVISINDSGAEGGRLLRKYLLSFTSKKSEIDYSTAISVNSKPQAYERETGKAMSVSFSSFIVELKASPKYSSDATLAYITLGRGILEPDFMPTVFEYRATVPYEENGPFYVSAETTDSKATVSMIGGTNLQVGENIVILSVVAEDKTTRNYVITVNMLEKEETIPAPGEVVAEDLVDETLIDKEQNVTLVTGNLKNDIVAYSVDQTIYLSNLAAYKIISLPEGYDLPDGYRSSYLKIDNIIFPCYLDENATSHDFVLVTLENSEGESGWYRLDRAENTIQRLGLDEITITTGDPSGMAELKNELATVKRKNAAMLITVIVLGAWSFICGGFIVILIIKEIKTKKNRPFEEIQ